MGRRVGGGTAVAGSGGRWLGQVGGGWSRVHLRQQHILQVGVTHDVEEGGEEAFFNRLVEALHLKRILAIEQELGQRAGVRGVTRQLA